MPRHPARLHPSSLWLRWVWCVLDVTPTLQRSGPPPDSVRACVCVRVMTRTQLPSKSHDANYLFQQGSASLPADCHHHPPLSLFLLNIINVSLLSPPPPLFLSSLSPPPSPSHHMETITSVVVSHHQHSWGLSSSHRLYINLVLLSPCSHRS